MDKINGWKTIIFSGLTTVTGILAMMGVPLPGNFADEATGAVMTIIGLIGAILRTVTTGPVGWQK